jgi:hypothetical protein
LNLLLEKEISSFAKPFFYNADNIFSDPFILFEMGECSLDDLNKERIRTKDIWSEIELLNLIYVLVEYCYEYSIANVFHRDIKP